MAFSEYMNFTYNNSVLPPRSRSISWSFVNLIGSFSPFPSGWKHKTTSIAETSMILADTFLTNLSAAVIRSYFHYTNARIDVYLVGCKNKVIWVNTTTSYFFWEVRAFSLLHSIKPLLSNMTAQRPQSGPIA